MATCSNCSGGRSGVLEFIVGTTIGVAAGVVAGLLIAPRTGKETREQLTKMAQDFASTTEDAYQKAALLVQKKLKLLKKLGTKIDQTKYVTLVNEVLAELKNDGKVTSEVAKKLGEQLKTDWTTVKTTISK